MERRGALVGHDSCSRQKELVGQELRGGFEGFQLPSSGTLLNINVQETTTNMSRLILKF